MKAGQNRTKSPVFKDLRSLEDAQRIRVLADFTAGTQHLHPAPFAAELVDSKSGRRLHRVVASPTNDDPTCHPEVCTIRTICKKRKSRTLPGCTLYTTCEPCPMCMALVLWAKIDRVVYGATLDDAGQFWPQIYTYARQMVKKSDFTCEVVGPVERERCLELFRAARGI